MVRTQRHKHFIEVTRLVAGTESGKTRRESVR